MEITNFVSKPIKYPGLDDNETKLVEGGNLSYKDLLNQKLREELKNKKISTLNEILYQAKSTGNKELEKKHGIAAADNMIIEYGRDNLIKKGFPDEPDELILAGFKKKYGDQKYRSIVDGGQKEFDSLFSGNEQTLQSPQTQIPQAASVMPTQPKKEGMNDIGKLALATSPLTIPLGAVAVGKRIVNAIPTENKVADIVQYVKQNVANYGGQFKPEFVDKKAKNFLDYFANMDKSKIKKVTANKLGAMRGLYNQIGDDLLEVATQRGEYLNKSKDVFINGSKILAPLEDAIRKGGLVGELGSTQDSKEVYREIAKILKMNKGGLSVEDVERLKEFAYENYDYSKSTKAGVTMKDLNRGKAYKLLARGAKEALEEVIPALKPLNESYGKLKDMALSSGKSSVKLEKMVRFTTLGKLRRDVARIVSAIPGVSAISNIDSSLLQPRIDEKKLGEIMTKSKNWSKSIGKFLDKYGKTVSKKVATGGTGLIGVLPSLGLGLVTAGKLPADMASETIAKGFDEIAQHKKYEKNPELYKKLTGGKYEAVSIKDYEKYKDAKGNIKFDDGTTYDKDGKYIGLLY